MGKTLLLVVGCFNEAPARWPGKSVYCDDHYVETYGQLQ